jgi:hypothetical protein
MRPREGVVGGRLHFGDHLASPKKTVKHITGSNTRWPGCEATHLTQLIVRLQSRNHRLPTRSTLWIWIALQSSRTEHFRLRQWYRNAATWNAKALCNARQIQTR